MELGEQRDHRGALGRIGVAELAGAAVHEREQRDRVARSDPAQRLAGARADRRDDELEACVAQGGGGVECAPEAVERRIARVPEPGLLVEVVDGDERGFSLAVTHDPVVAPGPDRRVVGGRDVEVPAVGERTGERADVELLRQSLHRIRLRTTNSRFAGRSASRRIRYGYHSGPYGVATSTL